MAFIVVSTPANTAILLLHTAKQLISISDCTPVQYILGNVTEILFNENGFVPTSIVSLNDQMNPKSQILPLR